MKFELDSNESIILNSALKTYTFDLKDHLSETSKGLEHVEVKIISFCLNWAT